MTKALNRADTLRINEQWINKKTKEPFWISTVIDGLGTDDNRTTVFLVAADGLRLSVDLCSLVENYEYVPHMKGAYK